MGRSGTLDQRPAWTREQLSEALGESALRLIATIAKRAHAENIAIYLVGGVVRDLLLERENLDLDFVLEGDAIAFACKLARIYGGETERHAPFGTAKWKLDSAAISNLSLGSEAIPAQIDFATARTEEYPAPAALPAVEPGLIWQDLRRRDFTVNALALRVEAGSCPWQMLDPGDGYSDILGKKIRVLHAQSFIDDPTRIFRAFRFASRFGFTIESSTADILHAAIPMIQRLSGERIRHELDLILREKYPERIIADLSELDIFSQIHDSFLIGMRSTGQLKRLREHMPQMPGNADDIARLGWHLLFSSIAEDDALLISARLGLTGDLSNSIAGFARLLSKVDWLGAPATKASAITRFLDGVSATALRAALICNVDDHAVKERMESYMADWRHRRTTIDGNDLIRAGLAPGPIYREILDKLRGAWIDGEIESGEQERELFLKLVKEAK
ncbi:MAG: hypothetical protein OXG39_10910 [Chloroflexi bacterium]|nr:hypothetical protein [Chloroflexota bacterium]